MLANYFDLLAQRLSHVELADCDIYYDGQRIAEHQPQRPEEHTESNDREQSGRWGQRHGTPGDKRHNQIAFDLLHHDEHHQRPGDRVPVFGRGKQQGGNCSDHWSSNRHELCHTRDQPEGQGRGTPTNARPTAIRMPTIIIARS
jgi:hypothetical protein